jgi:hypothetical protein
MIRTLLPQRFFSGTDRPSLTTLSERFPDARRQVLADADQRLSLRFDLLGYRGLWFGDPIDWSLDPVWARRTPLVHWSRLNPLDASVGDSKIVWELNRHQWVVRLAQAHALTGDSRYAEACVRVVDEWIDANPPGVGLNWASSLEVAFRLMSWSWTLALLRHWPALPAPWVIKVLAAIGLHAAHVRRYLSYYFSPNTHLTGEALGLFYAGTLFPEFRGADDWRQCGRAILDSQSSAQVSGDGVHFEQSTCYHRYTLEIFLHFLLLAARNGIAVSQEVLDRTARMADFLVAIRRPDGVVPSIGDDDGGQLMPLVPREHGDCRGVLAIAAAIHQRPDFSWAAGGAAPEVLWLMGSGGTRRVDRAGVAVPASAPSQVFAEGGYAILRDRWDNGGHQMIVDIGPLGCPVTSGHGHADLLSVQCAIFGEPCLIDAGTGGYTPDTRWRSFFRGTAAHSALTIDGQSQVEPDGPFGWRGRPAGRLLEWHSTTDFDLVDAAHDGYLTLARPVAHRRRVIFMKPAGWILIDDLTHDGEHRVDLSFQFAPMPVTAGPGGWMRAETPGGSVLWVHAFAAAPLPGTVYRGQVAPIRGWVSPEYGQRQPAPTLVYSSTVALPWRVVTVLMPQRGRPDVPPAMRPIHDPAGVPVGVSLPAAGRTAHFGDDAVRIDRI